jgi:hypothetical protein
MPLLRTTIDLPDDLHQIAMSIARDKSQTLSETVAELIRAGPGPGAVITSCGERPRGGYVKRPCYLWQGTRVSTVVALLTNTSALTVSASAEVFLDSLGNPNTIRNHGPGGRDRRPARWAAAAGIGGRRRGRRGLELLWGTAAAKSRHKKPDNLRRYFKPSDQAPGRGHQPAGAWRQPRLRATGWGLIAAEQDPPVARGRDLAAVADEVECRSCRWSSQWCDLLADLHDDARPAALIPLVA